VSNGPDQNPRAGVERLFAAIESRDLRRVGAALSPDVTWQNVPHPPVVGRTAVVAMLADILRWSDEVRWDIVSATADDGGTSARVDRFDRFWIDGEEHAVRCDGEFEIDATGAVSSVRDRVELDEWRARIVPVYERMRTRDAHEVATRHCAAVRRREVVAMAADYALDASLRRDDTIHRGWSEIAEYFDDAVNRLGDRAVVFGPIQRDGAHRAAFTWRIVDGDVARHGDGDVVVASGRDEIETADGFITRQTVTLHDADF